MSDELIVTIERNQADAAYGQTGFAMRFGYISWDIPLGDVAALFRQHADIDIVLRMASGDTREVVLRGELVKTIAEERGYAP